MSSMHNAIPRRSHRERPQPHSRTRRGLLEKHKDYVLRSQDHKRKQATLKRLSEKALERNSDEFYFGMTRQRTENGVPVADRPTSKALSVKEARPLKMQDGTYLRTMMGIDRRRIERLRGVVSGGEGERGKKILFAENEEEAKVLRERKVQEVKFGATGRSREAREFEGRMDRMNELKKKEREVTLQVQLMGKGSRQKVQQRDEDSDDEAVPVYKWKPQRQK